jgi:uncharacterized membrane protein YuzA (DUF378 family)
MDTLLELAKLSNHASLTSTLLPGEKRDRRLSGGTYMRTIDVAVAVLLVIGGINWGLVGVLQVDLVAALLGEASALSRIIYAVVGLCAVYQAGQWKAIQRRWGVVPAMAR